MTQFSLCQVSVKLHLNLDKHTAVKATPDVAFKATTTNEDNSVEAEGKFVSFHMKSSVYFFL